MELLLENRMDQELSHEELIEQYKESLAPILEKRKNLKLEIDELEEFILNNKRKSKRKTAALERQQLLKAEDKVFAGMQGDMEYAINWMKNGHAPGVIRGIERQSAYVRERPFDPLTMQRFFRSKDNTYTWDDEEKENALGKSDIDRITAALSVLTEREKELYLMSKGNSMTYGQIAKQLGVRKSTVSTAIYRAEKKIGKYLVEERGSVFS